ncbi:GNAT family N-acetyltransferase [Bacilliculturomica massiliensis]|uniref:GNAT family N-acetyltransferase n=1 Tax=Bacilliculturomica massiliensis TaxID=1917867 RepID=UPI0010310C20|nr:GNAT family N-acetyltransferase [Bacilliculturomica massiliensis]
MKEYKLDGNYFVKIYEKADEEEYMEMRRSKIIKHTDGFDALRYQPMTDPVGVLLLVEKDDDAEIPVGFAVIQNLDDKEYQKAASTYFGIELNCKYFISDFIITQNYRRSGIGRLFMHFVIEEYCKNESLMMNPNEDDSLFWHSVGFAYVGTDKKHGMRVN